MFKQLLISLSALSLMTACSSPEAQEKPQQDKAEKPAAASHSDKTQYALTRSDLGQGVYMLAGSGGNIGLSVGADGAFVIDDQFAKHSPVILNEINALTDGDIRFVVNTHYHGDHTGGNAAMKATGATIIAHDNVRVRMGQAIENQLWGRTVGPEDPGLWPTVTFSETMTFHFNGQTIDVIHTPSSHTDGDAIIYFREADVLHMGDNFFNGLFPYIDIDAGGSVDGMLAALDKGLMLAGPDTKIMPGHGAVSNKANMQDTRDLLAEIQNRVKARMDAGESLEDILDAKVLTDHADLASFINEESMVRIAFRSLTGQRK